MKLTYYMKCIIVHYVFVLAWQNVLRLPEDTIVLTEHGISITVSKLRSLIRSTYWLDDDVCIGDLTD